MHAIVTTFTFIIIIIIITMHYILYCVGFIMKYNL